MPTQQKDNVILPRKLGDRVLLFLFGTVLVGFFALMTFAMQERMPTDWLGSLLQHIAVDTMFTFAIFSLLTVVWALFTPRWIESAMRCFLLRFDETRSDLHHDWGFVLTVFREFLFVGRRPDVIARFVIGYD